MMKWSCLSILVFFFGQMGSAAAATPPPAQFPRASGVKSDAVLVINLTNGTAQSLPGLFDASLYCQAVLDFVVGSHTMGRVTVNGQTPLGPGRTTYGVETIVTVNNDSNSSLYFSRTVAIRHRFVSFDFEAASQNKPTISVVATAIMCGAPLFPTDSL